jgi:hypothetical protein
VSENDLASRFGNVADGNPILVGRLHTDVFAIVVGKPL